MVRVIPPNKLRLARSGGERLRAVRRGDRRDQREIPHLEGADSVAHRDPDPRIARRDTSGDLGKHIFGGERIVVYYLADGRVDFRELVRMLAGEFQTRTEMRQIGVRDEAKLMPPSLITFWLRHP